MGRLYGRFFAPSEIEETPSGTPDGTRTAFTLASTPANAAEVQVFLNGIKQQGTADFTVSGTTITMATAPLASQAVTARYIKAN